MYKYDIEFFNSIGKSPTKLSDFIQLNDAEIAIDNVMRTKYMNQASSNTKEDKKLKWWQLSLLGVAGTIGTGYFLGSGLAPWIHPKEESLIR